MSKARLNTRRSLLVLALMMAATPLAAGKAVYSLRCLIDATKACYDAHGISIATLQCIVDASASCKVN